MTDRVIVLIVADTGRRSDRLDNRVATVRSVAHNCPQTTSIHPSIHPINHNHKFTITITL